jgi:hypothetical protein
MSGESDFKILVSNQSNDDRIIKAVIAAVLILAYLVMPSSIDNMIALFGVGFAGIILFNAISGNYYIYRRLESTHAHYLKPKISLIGNLFNLLYTLERMDDNI